MTRGVVLPLSQDQILQRMRYLVGEAPLSSLDKYINKDPNQILQLKGYYAHQSSPIPDFMCPNGYYLLKDYNGGVDPTTPDPFTRWKKPRQAFTNVTCDCIGGMAWCGGWDRLQLVRFSHLYGGYINTDSIFLDVEFKGGPRCFKKLKSPRPGCFLVAKTGSRGHEKCGHIGGVLDYDGVEFDAKERDCWKRMRVANVAATGQGMRANVATTGLGWWNADAIFVESIMVP